MDTPAPDRDFMVEYVASRDVPCPCCGYNLRGLTGTRCPECNEELVLRVGMAEPRIAWFIAGVVGVGMCLGFCALLLVWALYMGARRGPGGPPLKDLVPLAAGVLVGAGVLCGWIRAKRRLGRASTERRWIWACAAAAASFVCPTWFMLTVR